jgi:SulP family sulfate permease
MSKELRVTSGQEERPLDNTDASTIIYRLDGAFFFGAVATASSVLDRIADGHRNLVLDCTGIQFIDTSGANMLAGVIRKAQRGGVRVYVVSDRPELRLMLSHHEPHGDDIVFTTTLNEAQWAIHGNTM